MKHKIYTYVSVILLGLLLVVTVAWRFRLRAVQLGTEQSLVTPTSAVPCGPNFDLRINIDKLSSDAPEANQAVDKLLALAKESVECRDEIVSKLLQAMNKPNLNFEADRPSYFLWSKGATILGKLKAVEALDLLIDHLDLNDGVFSASMSHQPAVRGVEAMGVVAVPKLGIALHNNANRNLRLAAALCLADIGGPEAMDALKQALSSESDQCVRRFISLSIGSPADRKKSKPQISGNDANVLWQKLLAFRCDN